MSYDSEVFVVILLVNFWCQLLDTKYRWTVCVISYPFSHSKENREEIRICPPGWLKSQPSGFFWMPSHLSAGVARWGPPCLGLGTVPFKGHRVNITVQNIVTVYFNVIPPKVISLSESTPWFHGSCHSCPKLECSWRILSIGAGDQGRLTSMLAGAFNPSHFFRWSFRITLPWSPMCWKCQSHSIQKPQKTFGFVWKIGYIPNYSHLIGIMIINHWV